MAAHQKCPSCGGFNTSGAPCSMTGHPSLGSTILIGVWYLLVRAIFVRGTRICHNCGNSYQYRTNRVAVAIVILLLLSGLIAWTVGNP